MNRPFQMIQMQLDSRIYKKQISYGQFKSKYRIGQELGKGAFGKVHKIYGLRSKKSRVIKQIILRSGQIFQQAFTEVEFQVSLAHPLVVKVFEFYCLNPHRQQGYRPPILGMVMELGSRTLLDYIQDPYQNFKISQFLQFSHSFIQLFAYFQDNNIVHRDIKPANFIQFGQGLNFKLTDFGLCCNIQKLPNYGGTREYLSPNLKKILFKGQKLYKQTNSFKDDVYSLGVTFYEMITRKVGAGYSSTFKQVYEEILRFTQSVQVAQMINLMLSHEEKDRPDFIQLIQIFQENWMKPQNPPPQILQKPQILQCDLSNQQSKMGLDYQQNQNFQNFSNRQDVVFNSPKHSEIYNQKDHISIVFNSQPRFPEKLEVAEKLQESSILEKTQNFSKKEQAQIPIFDTPPTLKNDSPKQKIQQKQQTFEKWSMDLNRDLKIASIQKIQNNLIIGSSNGKMFLVKLNDYSVLNIYEIVGMKKVSKNPVNIIQKDCQQNLWIPNHDNTISIWNKQKLLQFIADQSCIRLQNNRRTSIFNRKIQTDQLKFFIPEQVITSLFLSASAPSSQISCMLPYSESHFIIGHCDGFIQIKWQNQQIIYKIHTQSITSINLYENMLYTSSLDGFVKMFQMDKFVEYNKNMNSQNNQAIVKNIIIGNQLYVFMLNGKVYQVTLGNNNIVSKTLQNQVIQDVLSAVSFKKNAYSLSSQGLLMKNGKNIDTISHNQGWSNMLADQNQNFIFLVNKKDKITILKFNQQ